MTTWQNELPSPGSAVVTGRLSWRLGCTLRFKLQLMSVLILVLARCLAAPWLQLWSRGEGLAPWILLLLCWCAFLLILMAGLSLALCLAGTIRSVMHKVLQINGCAVGTMRFSWTFLPNTCFKLHLMSSLVMIFIIGCDPFGRSDDAVR